MYGEVFLLLSIINLVLFIDAFKLQDDDSDSDVPLSHFVSQRRSGVALPPNASSKDVDKQRKRQEKKAEKEKKENKEKKEKKESKEREKQQKKEIKEKKKAEKNEKKEQAENGSAVSLMYIVGSLTFVNTCFNRCCM